jgi:hypothetical protein
LWITRPGDGKEEKKEDRRGWKREMESGRARRGTVVESTGGRRYMEGVWRQKKRSNQKYTLNDIEVWR